MSGLLGSITSTLGRLFENLLPSWGDPAPVPPEKTEPSEPPELEAEPEAENLSISRIAMFEDIADQISDVYRRELVRLEGIKTKIVLIAHMYRFVPVGRFHNPRIDQDIAFPSEILDTIRQDRIDQTVSRQYHEILDKIDEMERNQHSGWTYEYGIKIFLEISAYQPFRGRSHFALPKIWAKPQLGIINPQNTDERCFEACLKAYLASEEARRQGTRARNLHDVAPLKNDKEQMIRKLDPLRISEFNYQREHLVDLILFTEEEEDLRDRHNINDISEGLNTHYCLINGENGWNQIMRTWNKYHGRKYFCRQREIFPEKGMLMKFKNYKAMKNVPFYFVKDLEADSDPIENSIINEKTIKLRKQKPNSYSYTLIQTDGKLAKEIARRTPNSIAES
ncbi:hypothetical protein RhiirA1_466131 [Rhizophagus irregularis]|uniref:Uncharacterized protein n=1 Tax=Rhizophagus irregularis TaxID=588596 RepID=A0A2N0REI0_9GLOM|nr:hypothetical protein RhiirA1_466131 [Rhizophagus irregularis]